MQIRNTVTFITCAAATFLLASSSIASNTASNTPHHDASIDVNSVQKLATKAKSAKKTGDKVGPKSIAIAYLHALEGKGDDAARDLLLGGLTLTAEEVGIPNWQIVSKRVLKEEKSVKDAITAMRDLDGTGRKTLDSIVNLDGEEAMLHITQEQAEKLLLPTKRKAETFRKQFPVFAYVARVGKDVFWHPANPWRAIVKKLGDKGAYRLELHRFNVEEDDDGKKRVWPLRVLRIRTQNYDSGWKILPASDWDPEY